MGCADDHNVHDHQRCQNSMMRRTLRSLEFCMGVVAGRHPVNFSRGSGIMDFSGTKPTASASPGFGRCVGTHGTRLLHESGINRS